MKRILLLLLFVLCALPVEARRRWAPPAAAGGGGGPTADLFNLDFEETGTPPGVTILSGTPNFDNTTGPLAGAQDCLCASTTLYDWNKTFTASNEVWITFEYQRNNQGGNDGFFYLEAGAQYVGIKWDGTSGVLQLSQTGGATLVGTADAIPQNGHMYIRLHAKNGSGANAIYDLEWNTANSFTGSGTRFTSYSAGSVTNQFVDVEHYHAASITDVTHLDNLKGSSTGWPP